MHTPKMPIEPTELERRLAKIKALVLDVDGVLTDGAIIVGDSGELCKRFHTRDGLGIKILQDSGVIVCIITGRTSKVVALRCAELGIEHVYQGCHDKWQTFQVLADKLSLAGNQFAYMGDDVVDLPVMSRVGVGMAVADAHPFVLQHAQWVSRYGGGGGAVREACEAVMQAHGTLGAVLQSYLD